MLAVLAQAKGSYLQFGAKEASAATGPSYLPIFLAVFTGLVVLLVAINIAIATARKKLGRGKAGNARNGRTASSKRARAKQRDKMQEFAVDYIDMDPLINPLQVEPGRSPRSSITAVSSSVSVWGSSVCCSTASKKWVETPSKTSAPENSGRIRRSTCQWGFRSTKTRSSIRVGGLQPGSARAPSFSVSAGTRILTSSTS